MAHERGLMAHWLGNRGLRGHLTSCHSLKLNQGSEWPKSCTYVDSLVNCKKQVYDMGYLQQIMLKISFFFFLTLTSSYRHVVNKAVVKNTILHSDIIIYVINFLNSKKNQTKWQKSVIGSVLNLKTNIEWKRALNKKVKELPSLSTSPPFNVSPTQKVK